MLYLLHIELLMSFQEFFMSIFVTTWIVMLMVLKHVILSCILCLSLH